MTPVDVHIDPAFAPPFDAATLEERATSIAEDLAVSFGMDDPDDIDALQDTLTSWLAQFEHRSTSMHDIALSIVDGLLSSGAMQMRMPMCEEHDTVEHVQELVQAICDGIINAMFAFAWTVNVGGGQGLASDLQVLDLVPSDQRGVTLRMSAAEGVRE